MNGWKVTAIIFIILFLLETSFFVYSFSLGTKELNNKLECSNEVCIGYDAFTYQDGLCNCWVGDAVVKQEILK